MKIQKHNAGGNESAKAREVLSVLAGKSRAVQQSVQIKVAWLMQCSKDEGFLCDHSVFKNKR